MNAAIVVLDELPTDAEICQHALDAAPGESVDIAYAIEDTAPDWLPTSDYDQVSAHLRDGAACVLVIYLND